MTMSKTDVVVSTMAAMSLVLGPSISAMASEPDGRHDEIANLSAATQRTRQTSSPAQLLKLAKGMAHYQAQRQRIDGGRQPNPNPCTVVAACPLDEDLAQFANQGGLVVPVLFTARSGATLSGHMWASQEGPSRRPAVLIINGSIVGIEQMQWFAAQALARAGFVVMTFDVQGEGMSDQFGEGPDRFEGSGAGTPAISLLDSGGFGGDGTGFYDGGADALNFLLSTKRQPYKPARSRTSGTSHADKQDRRVSAGLNAPFNPLWRMVDSSHVGAAGWSYGAVAASWLTQQDPRLDAAVAWDTLCVPVSPSPDEAVAILRASANRAGGLFGLPRDCFGAPPGPAPSITKPALGMTSDYLLTPAPYLTTPNPGAKSEASRHYSESNVDTGQITIRGGTHMDFADVPVVPATSRGIDMVTWYTVAWFKKYLQGDPSGQRMLLTNRWTYDAEAAALDSQGDGNMYSYHYRSRLDIGRSTGERFRCENLRVGCAGQLPPSRDCGPKRFSFHAVDTGRTPVTSCGKD